MSIAIEPGEDLRIRDIRSTPLLVSLVILFCNSCLKFPRTRITFSMETQGISITGAGRTGYRIWANCRMHSFSPRAARDIIKIAFDFSALNALRGFT